MDSFRSLVLPCLLVMTLCSFIACSSGGGDQAGGVPELPKAEIPSNQFVGRVAETMNAADYTYVRLERDGEEVWAAGPRTDVAVGDEVGIGLEMRMDGFRSESLGRTFDAVYFVSAFETPGAHSHAAQGADPHAEVPGAGVPAADPHAGLRQVAAADVDLGSITKPDGGYRVAELWQQRETLVDREVVVRGRVVKYNGGIMGRNWIHIQDGTGNPETGNHDLTITTDAAAAVGDLVTVRGVIAVDQDFGSGYQYSLLVEKASLEVE